MKIRHSRGAYPIDWFSPRDLLRDLPPQTYLLTDANVVEALGTDFRTDLPARILEPGEGNKSLEVYGDCLRWLAERGATRKSTLVALGGGVVGDLGGFVAASYMRGISFLQIPTTLLSQVDSSVGGKVGIDLPEGKNLVGAFYPPVQVRLSLDLLRALPERQFANGMAEVWKYGAIMDRALFEDLCDRPVDRNDERVSDVVTRCIRLKADVVEADEYETTGLRAILNFGHTVAHAVESLTGYGPVLHGEAVAIGMVAEATLGERLGLTPAGTDRLLAEHLARQGLPTTHPILRDVEPMVAAMRKDKKATAGDLAFSLLTEIGGCKLIEGVNEREVRAVLSEA